MKKYNLTFEFKETEEQAKNFCENVNKRLSYYMRKNKPAHFTPWSSQDGKEKLFVCWYYY